MLFRMKRCVPVPQANVHCLLHLNSCPDPQQPAYPLLNQGLRTGWQGLSGRFHSGTGHLDGIGLHRTLRHVQHPPGPSLNFLLLFLKYICKRNHSHTWGSSWIMFSYQNITEMKMFSCKALLPHPNLHLHIFHPSEHWLYQQVGQRGIWGWFSREAFFLMKEVTHVGVDVPSATEWYFDAGDRGCTFM